MFGDTTKGHVHVFTIGIFIIRTKFRDSESKRKILLKKNE